MKINELRRANLRDWVKENGTPPAEKSYFSQVLGGASFGEKAARRIEQQYKMGEGFLDKSRDELSSDLQKIPESYVDAAEFVKLAELYQQSTRDGRIQILDAAESAEKIAVRRSRKATKDQA